MCPRDEAKERRLVSAAEQKWIITDDYTVVQISSPEKGHRLRHPANFHTLLAAKRYDSQVEAEDALYKQVMNSLARLKVQKAELKVVRDRLRASSVKGGEDFPLRVPGQITGISIPGGSFMGPNDWVTTDGDTGRRLPEL